ncbi:hypothetical protein VHEMI03320 [[Torrubiella] hemipterigena]|uniref:RNase III domain-containing protein n=1 Tax=[Torrubiella] hemipterigena TaxID=1531966 RepID=A0A0A1TAU8_9HYPO|nr:hypothetical protein VHEMI03320 [[Torrubiella] hemipterigena]
MALNPCRAALRRSGIANRQQIISCARSYSTESATPTATPESFKHKEDGSTDAVPRWAQTPPRMKAPMQMDFARDPKNKIWHVNSNPEVLDTMYNQLLGPAGSKMLPEELKWLAVTHKSFDQGRRGFNDRLAMLGRMTLMMEATKTIVSKQPAAAAKISDEFDRQAFAHEQLDPVDNLNLEGPNDLVGKDQLYKLAKSVGMLNVLRWKPRRPDKLSASGVEVVMNGAILAIIGAITLQRGLDVASGVVREHILPKLK